MFSLERVGNTCSFYKCDRCRKLIIVDMEDDHELRLAQHKAKCSPFEQATANDGRAEHT